MERDSSIYFQFNNLVKEAALAHFRCKGCSKSFKVSFQSLISESMVTSDFKI